MKKSIALLLTLACASSAGAQSLPEPTSYILHHGTDGGWIECGGKVDCARLPGKRGVWFDLDMAHRLVDEHTAYPEMRLELEATSTKAELISERLAICKDSVGLMEAEAHGVDAAIDDAVFQQREAEERAERAEALRDAWYNSKLLWYSAGLLSSVVVLGGAIVLSR